MFFLLLSTRIFCAEQHAEQVDSKSILLRVFKVEKLTLTANPESNLTPSFLALTGALGDRI